MNEHASVDRESGSGGHRARLASGCSPPGRAASTIMSSSNICSRWHSPHRHETPRQATARRLRRHRAAARSERRHPAARGHQRCRYRCL